MLLNTNLIKLIINFFSVFFSLGHDKLVEGIKSHFSGKVLGFG